MIGRVYDFDCDKQNEQLLGVRHALGTFQELESNLEINLIIKAAYSNSIQ